MHASTISCMVIAASLSQYGQQPRFDDHGPIKKDELAYQQQAYMQWWGNDLVLKLADLPTEGKVPDFRVPYCGHDYPDRAGGTINALYKYDHAFHGNRPLAAEHERMDVNEHRAGRGDEYAVRGLFGRVRMVRNNHVPTWYGHCNGWTAAAIRHAEPQKSVVRNGVTFTPADIKGLLAELYMYTDTEFLGGIDPAINPGTLHLTLANWLGRGSHPLGMETAVGETVINYPVFAYKGIINKLAPRKAEVKTTITYALNINREMDKSPVNYHRQLWFHYVLDLDNDGRISGGQFYGDSGQIDMLWTPLQPTQGGEEKNKRGNPHLKVKEVLAIWRESVNEDLRKEWLNIDPTDEDRLLPLRESVVVNDERTDSVATGPNRPADGTVGSAAPAATSEATITSVPTPIVDIAAATSGSVAENPTIAAPSPR